MAKRPAADELRTGAVVTARAGSVYAPSSNGPLTESNAIVPVTVKVSKSVAFTRTLSVTEKLPNEVVKYATFFPGGFYSSAFGFFMNEDKWNALPKQDQDALLSVSGEVLARLAGMSED